MAAPMAPIVDAPAAPAPAAPAAPAAPIPAAAAAVASITAAPNEWTPERSAKFAAWLKENAVSAVLLDTQPNENLTTAIGSANSRFLVLTSFEAHACFDPLLLAFLLHAPGCILARAIIDTIIAIRLAGFRTRGSIAVAVESMQNRSYGTSFGTAWT